MQRSEAMASQMFLLLARTSKIALDPNSSYRHNRLCKGIGRFSSLNMRLTKRCESCLFLAPYQVGLGRCKESDSGIVFRLTSCAKYDPHVVLLALLSIVILSDFVSVFTF